jgi:CRISPR/Cas system-associated exonuclease Cas4 (RecB family)
VYYAQAVCYLHYAQLDRHYLTCSTPGGRKTISVRTNADPEHALAMIDKAKRIIEARAPLAKLSSDPSWWQCRFCGHRAMCHGVAA